MVNELFVSDSLPDSSRQGEEPCGLVGSHWASPCHHCPYQRVQFHRTGLRRLSILPYQRHPLLDAVGAAEGNALAVAKVATLVVHRRVDGYTVEHEIGLSSVCARVVPLDDILVFFPIITSIKTGYL